MAKSKETTNKQLEVIGEDAKCKKIKPTIKHIKTKRNETYIYI